MKDSWTKATGKVMKVSMNSGFMDKSHRKSDESVHEQLIHGQKSPKQC
ncbi:hypothetical protein ACWM35_17660 [Neobacillus sp. K501]